MIIYTLCLLYFLHVSVSYSLNRTYRLNDENVMTKVMNGWPARLGDVPYQVAFKRSIKWNRYTTFCGGVIIAPTKLLSAAHCFTEKPNMCDKLFGNTGHVNDIMLSHTYAVAGQLSNVAIYHHRDTPGEGQWRTLSKVRYPPGYEFPKKDIAIAFLHKPFLFDNYVNSIPYASKFIDYSGKCLVSGFGRISSRHSSDKLLLAHLTLIPASHCNRLHRRRMHHLICTSSQYTDVGKGDSGGPLVCTNTGDPKERDKGILVGIVSGHAYTIGSFFTRVSSFYMYIEKNKSCSEWDKRVLCVVVFNLIHWKLWLF